MNQWQNRNLFFVYSIGQKQNKTTDTGKTEPFFSIATFLM